MGPTPVSCFPGVLEGCCYRSSGFKIARQAFLAAERVPINDITASDRVLRAVSKNDTTFFALQRFICSFPGCFPFSGAIPLTDLVTMQHDYSYHTAIGSATAVFCHVHAPSKDHKY